MAEPIRFTKRIDDDYKLEVDVEPDDCRSEPAHWHLYCGGYKIAKIWVDSCSFEHEPDAWKFVKIKAEQLTAMHDSFLQ